MNRDDVLPTCRSVLDEVSDAVIIDESVLETVLAGFVAGGHVLLEDVPGTGKTLTARSVAAALGLSFSRIQFTPDLLPTDVTGSHVFNEQTREFEFRPGPVFANVVLADEINRTSPKTQAALLEAMGEGQVTVGGESRPLPEPFFVIATQNPVEQEGTFELPEAQKDRFMIKTSLGYPDEAGELELVDRRADRGSRMPGVQAVCTDESIARLRQAPEEVYVAPEVRRYLVGLARATREHEHVSTGISPRGTERLFEASRALAAIRGRDYVTPDEVKFVAPRVFAHRLALTTDARIDGVEGAEVVAEILAEAEVPTISGASGGSGSQYADGARVDGGDPR